MTTLRHTYTCALRTTTSATINIAAQQNLELQTRVLAQLPEDQTYLHVKTAKHFAEILQSPQRGMITVSDKSHLVGQAVAILPDAENPDIDMADMPLPEHIAPEACTTLCAVVTDPAHRGCGLMGMMIRKWIALAEDWNRPHLFALITVENIASWSQFLNNGLEIIGGGIDPDDNSNVFYAYGNVKELKQQSATDRFNQASAQIILNPASQFEEICKVLSDGYRGIAPERNPLDNRYTGQLVLQ